MVLSVGDKLGPYEILEAIGQGGMGAVYRARDTRLGRDVAIKVSDQKFSERFEREARVISSLNHPNICTLHDVGPNYLVMELVEGQTLAERIREGAIPLEESLNVGKQIADALEAAHEKGVVHRDLKPGNVMIRNDGSVKVLDFGLAKVAPRGAASDPEDPELSPTISLAATQAGVVLGTAAYMSPEQARGKPVDKRADIWAFGVVLYEMITGKKLFAGEDLTDTLASVVKIDPDLSAAPLELQPLLKKCLEKDPRKRLRDISGVEFLLDAGLTETRLRAAESERANAAPQAEEQPPSKGSRNWLWPAIAAGCAILAAGVVLAWAPWSAEPLKPLVRLEVDLGDDVTIAGPEGPATYIALSPDGTRLAYAASVAGAPPRLYTRRLDQVNATELPGTVGASSPFFSPDSQWIGFASGPELFKISVDGGAVVPLADLTPGAGAAWGADDSILIAGTLTRGMRRLPSSRGSAGNDPAGPSAEVTLTDLGNGEVGHVQPQFLPGGEFVLFSVIHEGLNSDTGTIEVLSLAGEPRKVVMSGGLSGTYLPSGHLVYVNKNTLFAVPFDVDKLETRSNPVPILDDVRVSPITGNADLAFASNGTLVYRTGGGTSGQETMQWIDPAGTRSPLLAQAGFYGSPRVSPDGRRIALAVNEGGSADIGIYDPERDALTKLTFGGGTSGGGTFSNPVWTPDGRFILFYQLGAGIVWTRADGAGQPQTLVESNDVLIPWSMSPDGKHLAFFKISDPDGWLYTVDVTEEGSALQAGMPARFFESKSVEIQPSFSPDGRWIAYQTSETGGFEVVVRPFPPAPDGQGGKWQISTGGGANPRWSRNTNELLYQTPGGQVMAVSYTVDGDSFVADKPRVKLDNLGGTDWDLAPDGRAVVLAPAGSAETPIAEHTVVFLQNLFDELKRRVPVQ